MFSLALPPLPIENRYWESTVLCNTRCRHEQAQYRPCPEAVSLSQKASVWVLLQANNLKHSSNFPHAIFITPSPPRKKISFYTHCNLCQIDSYSTGVYVVHADLGMELASKLSDTRVIISYLAVKQQRRKTMMTTRCHTVLLCYNESCGRVLALSPVDGSR